jgi:hypothetical protein
MMRKIKVYLDTGFAGCKHEDIIEVDDDITDEDVDEIARDTAFNWIEWGWYDVEEDDDEQE